MIVFCIVCLSELGMLNSFFSNKLRRFRICIQIRFDVPARTYIHDH